MSWGHKLFVIVTMLNAVIATLTQTPPFQGWSRWVTVSWSVIVLKQSYDRKRARDGN